MSVETSSKYTKLHKKVKLAIGRSKNSKDNVETLDSKKKGQSQKNDVSNVDDKLFKRENSGRSMKSNTKDQHKARSRTFKKDDISYVEGKLYKRENNQHKARSRTFKKDDVSYVDGKLYKRENTGGKSMNSKTNRHIRKGQEGYETVIDRNGGFKQLSSNWKQMRIYADHDKDEKGTFHNNVKTPNRKDLSKAGRSKLNDDFVKDNHTTKGSHDSEQSSRKNYLMGRRSYDNESLDRKGGASLRDKPKAVYKVKNDEVEGSWNGMLMKGAKRKSDSNKQLHWNQSNREAEFLEKSAKKKYQDKRNLADDSAVKADRPKKRKRVIRIDPHDITNKRLDDTLATNDNSEEKQEDLEKNKNLEMSMNAQFRAIQPSPSILSFVEENFLGRRRDIELRRAGYNTELSVPLDNIPFSTSSERERIEETVFRNKLTFFAAAKISSSVPPPDLPEIAFAGRSNVGKSSLLNALTRQWGVVRTSDKPGLTQTINFFNLGSKLCLVDLPGYGFAYAKEEVKEAWEELVKEYVSTRVGLKRVCLLIDTKWGMKPRDHELVDLMERSQTKYQIVLTKTDTVFPIDVARRAMQIEESFTAKKSAVQPVMMVSSKSGAGIRSLRTALTKIARFVKP